MKPSKTSKKKTHVDSQYVHQKCAKDLIKADALSKTLKPKVDTFMMSQPLSLSHYKVTSPSNCDSLINLNIQTSEVKTNPLAQS